MQGTKRRNRFKLEFIVSQKALLSKKMNECNNARYVLLEEIRMLDRPSATSIDGNGDAADLAFSVQEEQTLISNANLNSALLVQLDIALLAIKNGEYGKCQECKGEIHDKRLVSIPWATLCIHCQEQAEREQGK